MEGGIILRLSAKVESRSFHKALTSQVSIGMCCKTLALFSLVTLTPSTSFKYLEA